MRKSTRKGTYLKLNNVEGRRDGEEESLEGDHWHKDEGRKAFWRMGPTWGERKMDEEAIDGEKEKEEE